MLRRLMCVVGLSVLLAAQATAAEAEAGKPKDENLNEQLEAAQERLDEAAREVAELSMALSEDAVPFIRQFHAGGGRRAVLGINIGVGSEDAEGVKVISVSPGGPAARAGLQAGDLLVRIDDVVLKRDDERSARGKLLQRLRGVAPGQTVKVEYRRGNQKATVDVKAEAPEPFDVHVAGPPSPLDAPMAPRALMFGHAAGGFGAAEIVPLTKNLGRYFGADEGLLIVRAPRDEQLKLEDGDVLLDIDGRKPTSPAHALRILGSYQAGETVKLNVLRLKKRVALEVQVPERPARRRVHVLREGHGVGPPKLPEPPL